MQTLFITKTLTWRIVSLLVVSVHMGLVHVPEVGGVKIGIICDTDPDSWQYLYADAGAINIAIDTLVERDIISNDTISR